MAQSNSIKVLTIFGTRPEAIKMAPVVSALNDHAQFESILCVTGQHREMLDQVLEVFGLTPDFDLNVMKSGQSLTQLSSKILIGLEPIIQKVKPDWVLVHGDTATTSAAAQAAYYQSVAVGHIEAGLRTYDIYAPWPEEINRRIASLIASHHFAPTHQAKANLLSEGLKEKSITVTGNTVIDALFTALERLKKSDALLKSIKADLPVLDQAKKVILVTGHRRESFGQGFENICDAFIELAQRKDVQLIYPVHLNPYVQDVVQEKLSGKDNIHLINPLSYLPFVYLMSKSYLIITDSGGIQEEAPSLRIPVLLTRNATERPEAIECGAVKLVGQNTADIVAHASSLLDNEDVYRTMADAGNPYGDGQATDRILCFLLNEGEG